MPTVEHVRPHIHFDLTATGRRRAEAVVAALAGKGIQLPITPNDPVLIQRCST